MTFLLLMSVGLSLVVHAGATASVVINEVASTSVGGVNTDWIELSVIGVAGEEVNTNDYAILDGGHEPAAICSRNFTLTEGDHLVVQFSAKATGTCSYPYKLGACDELKLLRDGIVVSQFDYCREDSARGDAYTFSRIPDSLGSTFVLGTPTPGKANVVAPAGIPAGAVKIPVFGSESVASAFLIMNDTEWREMSTLALDYVHSNLSMYIDGELLAASNIGVRAKGQSSLKSSTPSCRWPLKVSMNEYKGSQRLGLERLRKFVLNPAFKDEAMNLREWIGYKLYADFGLAAPRTRFVNLHVNGELVGLYLLVEAVDTDAFLSRHFPGYSQSATMYKPEMNGLTCSLSSGSGEPRGGRRLQQATTSCQWPPASTDPTLECAEPNQIGGDGRQASGEQPVGSKPRPPRDGGEPPVRPEGQAPGAPQSGAQSFATCEEKVLADGEASGFGVQMGSNHSHVVALAKLLDNKFTPASKLDPYFNRSTLLRYLAVTVAIGQFDSIIGTFNQNYYLFDPSSQGRFEILPWDLNMGFGGFPGCSCGTGRQLFTKMNVTAGCGSSGIISGHLFRDKDSFTDYVEVMSDFLSGAFNVSNTVPAFARMAALIRPHVQSDPTRVTSLFSFDETVNTTSDPFVDHDVRLTSGAANALGRWLQVRPAVLQAEVSAYFKGTSTPSSSSAGQGSGCGSSAVMDPAHVDITEDVQLESRAKPACESMSGTTTTLTGTHSDPDSASSALQTASLVVSFILNLLTLTCID